MIATALTDIAQMVGGKLQPEGADVSVTGVSTDTRVIKSGDLFFALDGASFKGSDFLPEAIRGGASAAVTHNPRECGGPLVVVDDSGQALLDLAAAIRKSLKIPVVGITGSNGKTTTKDALGAVLGTRLRCVAAAGSYNNRVGMPLTMARVESDTEVLVLEIGTSAPGEIARLSTIAQPTLAVITSIGSSHLEGLGSIEGVLAEKLTIASGLVPDGILLLNADDKRLAAAYADIKQRGDGPQVESYGVETPADHQAYDAVSGVQGTSFRLTPGGTLLKSKLIGEHNLQNLLVVAVLARKLGLTDDEIAGGFAAIKPSPMRLEERRIEGRRVIFDCYNANPSSMDAAVKLLASSKLDGRAVAILGDMLELGDQSEHFHRELGQNCASTPIDVILFVGTAMKDAFAACEHGKPSSAWAANLDEARIWMDDNLEESDCILVKGSRGIGLEKLFEEGRK